MELFGAINGNMCSFVSTVSPNIPTDPLLLQQLHLISAWLSAVLHNPLSSCPLFQPPRPLISSWLGSPTLSTSVSFTTKSGPSPSTSAECPAARSTLHHFVSCVCFSVQDKKWMILLVLFTAAPSLFSPPLIQNPPPPIDYNLSFQSKAPASCLTSSLGGQFLHLFSLLPSMFLHHEFTQEFLKLQQNKEQQQWTHAAWWRSRSLRVLWSI